MHNPLYKACCFSIKSLLNYNCPVALNIWKLWKMVNFYHRTFLFVFLPRLSLGSIKSNIWQWLDLVGINQHVIARSCRYQSAREKKNQNIPHCSRVMAYFTFILFFASVQWKLTFGKSIGIYQYVKNYQNIPNGLSVMASFANWPRADRMTHTHTHTTHHTHTHRYIHAHRYSREMWPRIVQ